MKKIIRLTETELINVVKRVIDEGKLEKSTKEKDLDVKMDAFRDKIKNHLKSKDCTVKQVGTDFEIHCDKKHVGQVIFRRDHIIVKKKGNKFGRDFGFNEMGRIKAELNKVIRLTESNLTRIVKRVIRENEGKFGSDITNYFDENFTPDGGWDNDKYMDDWMNGGLTAYYVNGELVFAYEFEFIEDDFEEFDDSEEYDDEPPKFTRLLIGTNVVEKLDEVFGDEDWTGSFADWFIDKTNLTIDEVEYDDFKGMLSDYVDPSWVDDDWDDDDEKTHNAFVQKIDDKIEFLLNGDYDNEPEYMEELYDAIVKLANTPTRKRAISYIENKLK